MDFQGEVDGVPDSRLRADPRACGRATYQGWDAARGQRVEVVMLTMFLVGGFVGALVGFFLHAIFGVSQMADLAADCAACEANYQARLRRHQVKLDANDQEWWEKDHQFTPRVKGSGGWII
jgi:hypothetical protein